MYVGDGIVMMEVAVINGRVLVKILYIFMLVPVSKPQCMHSYIG